MLTPDILFDSYRDITPAFLQGQGVTLLLTDLDYTLAPKAVRRPDDALRQWIDGLKGAGITVMIVSNNRSGVRVTEFCGDLGRCCGWGGTGSPSAAIPASRWTPVWTRAGSRGSTFCGLGRRGVLATHGSSSS